MPRPIPFSISGVSATGIWAKTYFNVEQKRYSPSFQIGLFLSLFCLCAVEAPPLFLKMTQGLDPCKISGTRSRTFNPGNRSTWEKQWEASRWVSKQFKMSGLEVNIHTYPYDRRTWPNVSAQIRGLNTSNRSSWSLPISIQFRIIPQGRSRRR
jgi:hypothetical protein